MVFNFLISNPFIIGFITIILMFSDYFLTLAQEKERREHYSEHYRSYPVNTIEGNPAFVEAVSKIKIFNPKHFIAAILIGVVIPIVIIFLSAGFREIFLGYAWGLFFIVNAQHLNNLMGYRVSRKGLHGKLLLHQRTGLRIQSARYLSITILLLLLSILSGSQIIYGATIAGLTSTFRLFILSRKVAPIAENDLPPENV